MRRQAGDKDYFELRGEMLTLPPGQGFSIYSLAAVLPLLAAKQRLTHANDWMTSDAEIACPDPNCPSRLRITRLGLRRFSHQAQTTAVPSLPGKAGDEHERCGNDRSAEPDYTISRVIRGGWQLAGGHGPVDRIAAVDDLIAAFDAGIFTFDCADIYTGVEELYGAMRARLRATRGEAAAARLKVHTKLVPDLAILPEIARSDVEGIIDTSLRRLRVEALDVVQFHRWDYAEPRWLEALHWLDGMRAKGKIRHLGGYLNFDTPHAARR